MPTPLKDALTASLERIRRHHRTFGSQFPLIREGSSYQLAANDNWLTGFWTGLLWLAYAASRDEDLRQHAQALLPSFKVRLEKRVHINHDLGFLFSLSARAQWQTTGEREAWELALQAAQDLAQRYHSPGKYIQAWGEVADPEQGDGYALAAQWCEEPRFLEVSQRAARRFMAELPPEGVPWWDLRLPADAPHYYDSSAGAIAVCGMLRLARLDDESEFHDLARALGEPGLALSRDRAAGPRPAAPRDLSRAQGLGRGRLFYLRRLLFSRGPADA
jgi:hypothetical protein